MVKVRAFKAIRPKEGLAEKIAALPYDVMTSDEAREMVKDNPYSFLHVDRAEIDLDKSTDVYDKKVYEKARDNLNSMINRGLLIEDIESCMYIYRQTSNEKAQVGLVVCCSIDDYINNSIKKHEFTRKSKEKDRINHVDYCGANTGPIFLTYRKKNDIDKVINKWICREPIYNFLSEDKVKHEVWAINDKKTIEYIESKFLNVENLYIADGHHRAASAISVGLKRRGECPDYTGNEEFNYFLGVIFPHDQLNIVDYNRVITDLNSLSKEEFLKKVSEKFWVKKLPEGEKYKPKEKYHFGVYFDNEWYEIKCKDTVLKGLDRIKSLDVSILQDNILYPILGIENPREDNRIDFVGGIRGLEELERRVNKDMTIAFSLYPTLISEIMDIADKGEVMPPKSTWFEPKLRSGLFIHKI